jgi:predicted helicase
MKDYIHDLNAKFATGDATEHTHRPALQKLLEELAPGLLIINEPKHIAVGAPDFTIRKPLGKSQHLAIGYVETKDIGADLDEVEKSEQLKRYLTLDNVLLTDYLEFRWYVGGKLRKSERLARPERGKLKLLKDGEESVRELLTGFLEHEFLPVGSPQELAKRMAALCRQIDRIIVTAFKDKQQSQLLEGLKEAFERTLLPDLSPEQFADMFTQTLAYGLFAARVHHHQMSPAEPFTRYRAAREIPKTNPFLRNLFETITGTQLDDEPFVGFVDDLTDLMNHADLGEILKHFGKRSGQQDAVVHFYETFLAAYDPKLRELRGVYYTPEPVVSYIVRSVDILLKEKFGLKDGLADRSTVEVEVEENGQKVKKTLPKVLILDPACGTGTFLYAVIDLIRTRFMESGNAGEWSDFVREHLLKRIYGFELLMAPYAVAHLKLAMQLSGQDLEEPLRSQWAYDFQSDERLNIFLTNSLEVTEQRLSRELGFFAHAFLDEARGARDIKSVYPIMVVIGNPPYSGNSANQGSWIRSLVDEYRMVDGEPMRERNPKMLQDDYVKFIRFAEWRIMQTGYGIIGLITNHSFLDNPTFRGMRQNLSTAFNSIYVLDLHGNQKKRERCPDGGKDENVFDIRVGTAITILCKSNRESREAPSVSRADFYGTREDKYSCLGMTDILKTAWSSVDPKAPFYLYEVGGQSSIRREYSECPSVLELFPINGPGIKTHRDELVVGYDHASLVERIDAFVAPGKENDHVYGLSQRRVLRFREYWAKERRGASCLIRYDYRPFDRRVLLYHTELIDRPRHEMMRHVHERQNLVMLCGRQGQVVGSGQWDLLFCTRMQCDTNYFRRGGVQVLPLVAYHGGFEGDRTLTEHANLSPKIMVQFAGKLGLKFVEDGRGDLGSAEADLQIRPESGRRRGESGDSPPRARGTFGPEDVFDYIYAIFHCPTYRTRYAEFLKIDFPRVPLTSNVALFRTLVQLGGRLVKLHLLEFDLPTGGHAGPPLQDTIRITYPVKGDHTVEKVRYVDKERQVWINGKQYFEGVPPDVWEFHIGGYQVAEKWLKDRKGRTLSSEDREHYRKIIAALAETIELMKEIDAAIPAWPIE